MKATPIAAASAPAAEGKSGYPQQFQPVVAGRSKKRLGDYFGLENFGVNLTRLPPGCASALLHTHSVQDEFIYVLEGTPTLLLDEQEFRLAPGDCMGFSAGSGVAHQLVNRSADDVVYLEVGDRSPGDVCEYPNDDLRAEVSDEGRWRFTHKDGRPW
jgi:uncharacterized cupin superfamily protein